MPVQPDSPEASPRRRTALLAMAVLAIGLAACERSDELAAPGAATDPSAPASIVGGEVCAGCHAAEAEQWQGSHHDLAMQAADESTVLGDFADTEFSANGSTTRFFRRGPDFVVRTEGPDGEAAEYTVRWTFGVAPLQQYLLELDDGRIQALSVAWDARAADDGGQRWFHLYPDEAIDFRDPLHWTGSYQRWNTNCADCHSTLLTKNYAVAEDRFATSYARIDVDCEACHGPGSVHAADPAIPPPALAASEHSWVFEPGQRIASRLPAAPATAGNAVAGAASAVSPAAASGAAGPALPEYEVCAQCHSRRSQLRDGHLPGEPLLDAYRPALLEPELYHADGQILDEVYVYGSFRQSRMAAAGVVCSDCHEPHSARLRAEGNGVCAQCHLASVYDQTAHHRHDPGSDGAQCVSCHMRSETYMVVDPRRDHSFRVPRPDLSAAIGSPNACTDCHAAEGSDWAAARVAEWYPEGRQLEAHYGQALAAGRHWAADAREQLIAVIGDAAMPEIVRATALELLAARMSEADVALIEASLERDEPLLRLAAVEAAAGLPPPRRVELLQRFLSDGPLAIRIAAARVLLSARAELSPRRQGDLDRAIADYLSAQAFNGDRPEGLLSAAGVAVERGQVAEAERLYQMAIERHPAFPALYVNLADLHRLTGQAGRSEEVLRQGIAVAPDDPGLELALGFAVVRSGRAGESLAHFERAVALAPDEPYYAYVLAIARNDAGEADAALELLEASHERFPGHIDTLFALATLERDRGDLAAALRHADALLALLPGDPGPLSLRNELAQGL